MDAVESAVVGAFRDIVDQITDGFYEAYELEAEAQKVAALVSLEPLDDLVEDLKEPLESAFFAAGEAALDDLEITEAKLFDLVHEDARAYAEDRAAELVGKRVVGGHVIDNPHAEWRIDEGTREGLKALVERSYSEGLSPAQLAKEIKASYQFSADRAKLIAKTETATASIQGSLAGWKRSGVVEGKESLLSDDHDHDDECDENADAGVIGLEDDFPSGDDGPPYHPGCNCSLVAELVPEGETDE